MSFQKTINYNPPIGVEGSFATIGTSHSVIAGVNALTAGATGVTVGRFAYADPTTGKVANAKTAGHTVGFVLRDDNVAVITNWQGQSSMLIPTGLGVNLFDRGDFFVKTKTVATAGQSVFADDTTGEISTGAAGATVAGSTEVPTFKVASNGAVGSLIKITAQ